MDAIIRPVTPGSISANQTICSGGDPVAFTSVADASGGGYSFVYQWQSGSSATGPWTDITPNGTNPTYDVPAGLSVTTYYRRRVTATHNGNGRQCIGYTNVISVTITALPTATIAYTGSPFCAIGTATVTQTGQNGGTYSSTAGLIINTTTGTINLATSTPGPYTITYSFTNGACPNTTTASITIVAFPTITTQPVSQTDCKGNSVDFSAGYSPAGTVTYQWQSSTNGGVTWSNIVTAGGSGSASASPIIYSATNIGVGGVNLNLTQYRVIITNSTGCSVTSNAAILTVNEITGITPANTSTVLCEGGSFSFIVTTSGAAPNSYQWKKDGVDLTNGTVGTVITTGATSATLTITGATPAQSGSYQVTIVFPITVPNNNGGNPATCTETSSLVRNVTVNPKPVANTASITKCSTTPGGTTAVFDLTSVNNTVTGGAAGVTVSWYSDAGLTTLIGTPGSYTNTSNPQTVYAKVTNTTTNCFNSAAVTLIVNPKPTAIIIYHN